MVKCKNSECKNSIDGKNLYCSNSCRNVYVNKNLRDYRKNGIGITKPHREKYKKNPKMCKNIYCGKEIPYEQKRNEFCGRSCSASVTNTNRDVTQATRDKMSSSQQKIRPKKEYYCKNCTILINCVSRKIFCSEECHKTHRRKGRDQFLLYKSDASFKFSLNQFPDAFDFALIKKYGWYAPSNSKNPNLGGISRDHRYSIKEGFKNNIPAEIIAHPANCTLMIHSDNSSKHKKCSITLEQLQENIIEWDKKYE